MSTPEHIQNSLMLGIGKEPNTISVTAWWLEIRIYDAYMIL